MNCVECGKEFQPKNSVQKFCGIVCAKKDRNRRYYQMHDRRKTIIQRDTRPLTLDITEEQLKEYKLNNPHPSPEVIKELKIFLLPHQEEQVKAALLEHPGHQIREFQLNLHFTACWTCSGDETETERNNQRHYKFIIRRPGYITITSQEARRRYFASTSR